MLSSVQHCLKNVNEFFMHRLAHNAGELVTIPTHLCSVRANNRFDCSEDLKTWRQVIE